MRNKSNKNKFTRMKKIVSKAVIMSILLCLMQGFTINITEVYGATYETSGTCGPNLIWSFDESTGVLKISGEGDMDNYKYFLRDISDGEGRAYVDSTTAPWNVYQYRIHSVEISSGIKSIGEKAFERCEYLTSISLPDTLISIGKDAFYQAKSLKNITLPNSITSIGDSAFGHTALTSITIPESVTSIEDGVFGWSALTNITIPESVTSIGPFAFSWTALTSVTIPGSVTSIGKSAFSGCELVNAIFCGNQEQYEKIQIGVNNDSLTAVLNFHEDLFNWTITRQATCIVEGEQRGQCPICGETEIKTIDKVVHKYEDTVIEPTCTEQGYTIHICSVCGDSYKDAYTNIVEHVGEWTIKSATCTEDGEKTRECTVCGNIEKEIIPKGHKYVDKIVKPTCTEQGYTLHTCAECNESYIDTYTQLSWKCSKCQGEGVIHWDCTSCGGKGYRTGTVKCSACGGNGYQLKTKSEQVTCPMCSGTGRYWSNLVQGMVTCASCSGTGKYLYKTTEEKTCSSCKGFGTTTTSSKCSACSGTGKLEGYCTTCMGRGKIYPDGKHNYVTQIFEPTYIEQGYTVHKCSLCGYSYKDNYIPKLTSNSITEENNTTSPSKVGNGSAGSNKSTTVKNDTNTSTQLAKVNFVLKAGKKKVTVKWNKVKDADGYIVYYRTKKKGSWKKLKMLSSKKIKYIKKGLKKGKKYYFTVQAYKKVNGKKMKGKCLLKKIKIK